MKTTLIKILFTIGFIVSIILVQAVAEILANVITMDMIMTVAYIVPILSLIYLIKS